MRKVSEPVLPQARKEGVVMQEVADELLVYDLDRNVAHCLNQTAAIIWAHCDGRTSLAQLTRALDELNGPADEEVIWMAVSQLRKRHLLTGEGAFDKGKTSLSRRQIIRRIGIAAAMGLPIVTTIIAPSAMQAASCSCMPPTTQCCIAGCPCRTGMFCCSGVCNAGVCA